MKQVHSAGGQTRRIRQRQILECGAETGGEVAAAECFDLIALMRSTILDFRFWILDSADSDSRANIVLTTGPAACCRAI